MLKKGDVIFTADNSEENISSLSLGYADLSYYHCSFYIGNGQIIEAIPNDGVIVSDVLKYQSNKNLVARLSCSVELLDRAIYQAHDALGAKYNDLFLPDTDDYYCSELIHKIFFRANNNSRVFQSQKLNYLKASESQIAQYWISLYKKHNQTVPHGKDGSHPNNLSLDNAFKTRFFIV